MPQQGLTCNNGIASACMLLQERHGVAAYRPLHADEKKLSRFSRLSVLHALNWAVEGPASERYASALVMRRHMATLTKGTDF